MSRWIEMFENHPFQVVWQKITEVANDVTADDETVVTTVKEIARLNKVILFLDGLLKSCDPELIPGANWDNFNSQAAACLQQINSYQNNRNISHISTANGHLDNLLTYIRPYQVVASEAAQSASASFLEYNKIISSNLASFQEKASALLAEIGQNKNRAESYAADSEATKNKVKEIEKKYFDDSQEESLAAKINRLELAIEDSSAKIQKYKRELLDGDSDSGSISSMIKRALDLSEADSQNIKELLADVKAKVDDFKDYHTVVFGSKNNEEGQQGGLKAEIAARKKNLDEFKEQQEQRYKALNEQIETLLPGATNAGLATAYYDLKVSFEKPIKSYSFLFYASIAFLALAALLSITQEVGWLYIKLVEIGDFKMLASSLLHKLPVILPILWLALFASKRRSEAQRLQQEYAHKEALSKSYQNFKTQIDELDQANPDLKNKLLSSAIDAISKNASDTLDKKHGDKTPMHDGVESFISLLEKIKKSTA